MDPIAESPREEYGRRLDALLAEEVRTTQRSNRLGASKLAAIALTLLVAFALAKYDPRYLYLLIAAVAGIAALFVLHDRTLRKLRRCKRRKSLYERGIARLEDRWAGTGQPGERFLDPAHPYARDLDLFGKGGMFELLSTARTRAGEDTLAAWLLAPAAVEEIVFRQEAVAEMRPHLDFREKLALAGKDLEVGVRPERLVAWSEGAAENLASRRQTAGPSTSSAAADFARDDKFSQAIASRANRRVARIVAPGLAALWILSLIGWAIWGWVAPVIFMSLLNLIITYRFRAGVEKAAAEIEEATRDLDLLAAIFRQIESANFSAKKLKDLQAALMSGKEPASMAISGLSRRVTWLESHENLIVKFADLFIFWTAQWVWAVEAWRARYGAAVRGWLAAAGEMEALAALSGYAYEHPADTFPEFVERGPFLDAEALAHPLLPPARAVANDLQLDDRLQLLVISGPNMAGKSTFIRSVGVNVVLAQAGAPVRAAKMTLSPLAVTASICVLDSLQGGLSRFYAEITRLKVIDDQSRGTMPVLFLLDELLSGTNSHDRRIGTESFVRSLLARGAIGLVTTHDLALAAIAESLEGQAANFHFEDRFENGELRFNYRLTPGVVSTTNALQLMRSVGLEV
ncbi:MAG: mismatch repair protein [Acidobacteriaceae bacterium]